MVLAPALHSVKEAVKTYEMQGGTANIFVNDDGIDALSPADKIRRIAFYSQNDIGWIARPMDGQGGFVRAGKFKKASNMVSPSKQREVQLISNRIFVST